MARCLIFEIVDTEAGFRAPAMATLLRSDVTDEAAVLRSAGFYEVPDLPVQPQGGVIMLTDLILPRCEHDPFSWLVYPDGPFYCAAHRLLFRLSELDLSRLEVDITEERLAWQRSV